MDLIQIPGPPPTLREPILLVGLGATGNQTPLAAASLLLAGASQGGEPALEPRVIAEFAPDDMYDFTVARPMVHLAEGKRAIEWPRVTVHLVSLPERDVLFLTGVEPHYRWRQFGRAAAKFADALGVREVILLSAFGGGTPHTRPVPLRWLPLPGDTAEAPGARFGLPGETPQYQGPATFTMALGVALRDAGLEVGGLSAIVPFYIGVDPSPHGVRSLASAVAAEYGLPLDTSSIDERIGQVDRHAEEQILESEPLATFVRNLEQQYDESRLLLPAPEQEYRELDAEDVLADVDRLLRDHRGDASRDQSRRA